MKKRLLFIFLIMLPSIYAECCSLNGSTAACDIQSAYQGQCKPSAYVLYYEDLASNMQSYGIIENGKLFQIKYENTTLDFTLDNGQLETSIKGDKARFSKELTVTYTEGQYGLLKENNILKIPADEVVKGVKIGSLFYESNATFNHAVSYKEIGTMIHDIKFSDQNYEAVETLAVRGSINKTVFAIEPSQINYIYAFREPLPIAAITPNDSLGITFLGQGMTIASINADGQRLLVSYQGMASIANNDYYQNEWKWKVGAISFFNLEVLNNNTVTLKQGDCKSLPNGFMSICFTINDASYFNITYNATDILYNTTMKSLAFGAPIFFKENKTKKIYIAEVKGQTVQQPVEWNIKEERITTEQKEMQSTQEDQEVQEEGIRARIEKFLPIFERIKRPLQISVVILGVLTLILVIKAREESEEES